MFKGGQEERYTLTVTAGPSRDPKTHVPVPVNTERSVVVETGLVRAEVLVRVQGFRNSSLPTTSPYFTHPHHLHDKYSLSLSPLIFTDTAGTISGDNLVLSNDFDKPIAQSLPPGFSIAWRVARWAIDPGLDGDPSDASSGGVDVITEGLWKHGLDNDNPTGDRQDEMALIPKTGPARMKYFVAAYERRLFKFQPGVKYWLDFFNPYLDFNEFTLKIPGISIPMLQYWDGQPLRYVLKNRVDGTVYIVVQFTLTPVDDTSTDGSDDEDNSDDDDENEQDGNEEEGKGKGKGREKKEEKDGDNVYLPRESEPTRIEAYTTSSQSEQEQEKEKFTKWNLWRGSTRPSESNNSEMWWPSERPPPGPRPDDVD
ncbi:hypothetical protein ABW21_db0207251 [Orbilia brochopaga]|nr:hypothetical protein ABW21_db0207251 [Drechslerella brochopaga]